MRAIKLKKMTLGYFKGVNLMEIKFGDPTVVRGANATGKTTLFDAFTWCLFGKDSTGKTDFEIKTKVNGQEVEKVPHSVTLVLDVSGAEKIFTRVMHEKWTKPRGKADAEFTGNETHYYVDGCEVKAKDYDATVSGLVDETLFRMITNPAYFPSLPWQKRREILLSIAGDTSYEDVAAGRAEFAQIIAELSGKDYAMFRQDLAYRRKRIKEELEKCPVQIGAIREVTPETPDYTLLEEGKTAAEERIGELNAAIADRGRAKSEWWDRCSGIRAQMQALKEKQIGIVSQERIRRQTEYNAANEGREVVKKKIETAQANHTMAMRDMDSFITMAENGLKRNEGQLMAYTDKRDSLRKEWEAENAREFADVSLDVVCPISNKPCTDAALLENRREANEKARAAFMEAKERRLSQINEEGRQIAKDIARIEADITGVKAGLAQRNADREVLSLEHQQRIAELEEELNGMQVSSVDLDVKGEDLPEWVSVQAEIEALQGSIPPEPESDTAALEDARKTAQAVLDEVKRKLAVRDTIENNGRKIAEIEAREKELAQQQAEIEGKEFALESLNRARMDEVEARVNKMFRIVKFAMFEKQINGNMAECCNVLVDGVKYGYGVNHAAEVNAGLDIINTLCRFNGVSAPIFIDNAESVCELQLPENSQVIRLVVDESCPSLRIER